MDSASLARIAEALDRLAPPPFGSLGDAENLVWTGQALIPSDFAALPLGLLTGIDRQKGALLENTRRHAHGYAAHDVLLWGTRGSGKSALARAVVRTVRDEGRSLSLVSVAPDVLDTLPLLFARLHQHARPTVLFIDDLGFDDGIADARAMRSVLDGGGAARPPHVRLYVTSNRRHIVARDMAEQDSAINVRDVVDDRLALADRFGLSLGFHAASQDDYLAMVERYARTFDLPFEPDAAIGFATSRGARSGRTAWHYIVDLAGSLERRMPDASPHEPNG